MLELILTLALNPINPAPVQSCVWPNTCRQTVAQVQTCVWPNTCGAKLG